MKHYFMIEVESDTKPDQVLTTVQNRIYREFGHAYRIARYPRH